MNWAALDSRFHSHRKVLGLRQHENWTSAVALWTLSMSWCADQERNGLTGRVPRHVAAYLLGGGAEDAALMLVEVGLWEDDSEGWRFHDWDDWNGIGGHELRSKENGRQRKARQRIRTCETGKQTRHCPTKTLDGAPDICPRRAGKLAQVDSTEARHAASRDADTTRHDTTRNDSVMEAIESNGVEDSQITADLIAEFYPPKVKIDS